MDKLQSFDLGLLYWLQHGHRPGLDQLMGTLTQLGGRFVLPFVAVAGALAFALARQRRTAACILLVYLLALLLGIAVKSVVCRPRPEITQHIIAPPTSTSFPSEHALHAMAIYGGLALVASRRLHYRFDRVLLIAQGIGLALLIGVTRLYIGVHFFTDVVAGWTAGLAFALLAYWMVERWGEPAVWEKLAAAEPAGSPSVPA